MPRKTRNFGQVLGKKGTLPTPAEVNQKIAKLAGTSVPTPIVKTNAKGRPKKGTPREKFTTVIDPTKRDQLKILAIHQKRTVADILDELISEYLTDKDL